MYAAKYMALDSRACVFACVHVRVATFLTHRVCEQGHAHNIAAVMFHPELPIIVSVRGACADVCV